MRIAAAVVLCAAIAAPAAAQSERAAPEGAAHWRSMAALDLEAAYRLVLDNHPGATSELGDDQLRSGLAAAIERSRAKAAQVDSYAGYVAVLQGFAVSLGDKHIWSRQVLRPTVYQWPGLAMAYRGGSWQVAIDARRGQDSALKGAVLVSCDGRSANDLAEERLGSYRGVWTIEAQRVQTAPYLFLDDGNPFLQRPSACEFEISGERRKVELKWVQVGPITLSEQLGKGVNVGAAGMGVREFEGGHWIALESLGGGAREVVDAVKAQVATLRRSPMVVLDLRGNGGGASSFGDEIARALMGDAYFARAQAGASTNDCPDLWRATPGNLEGLRSFYDRNASAFDEQSRAWWEATLKGLDEAVAKGEPFDGPVRACLGADGPELPPLDGRGSLLSGKMVILTDAECFSSCLLVTKTFRRLGALHVGDATDAATRYMEVREMLLPSGISYASTLQKVSLGSPRQIGPFTPSRRYEGDMSDTKALEAWVAGLR